MPEHLPSPLALPPLKLTCASKDCANDLHCFLQKKKRGETRRVAGPCSCGADLVEWNRVQAKSLDDIEYTFDALSKEFIRHEFWCRQIDMKAVNHARRKGRTLLRQAADTRIRNSVGGEKHPREGQQTPYQGNVIFYAQHALACCCRKCIEYWHGIPADRSLRDQEIAYFVELTMRYVERRLPELGEAPEHVPPIRSQTSGGRVKEKGS